ncbi:lasso peptide biosynthesis B2 protein [Marinicrinis lubricantis]|uniref:Lasso peptide biosynthesis B2 protein n=1 Tax=Marinicrinis lubricantis TaxID=2086470 RepID=A0ABW1IJU5_9BACL
MAKDRGTRRLLLEAWWYLAWARILKMLPFSKVAPSLGTPMVETTHVLEPSHASEMRRIARAVYTMSRHTFWESKCLVRAIAAMKMLERRKIGSTLYLGTARDDNGKMIAHAWLRSGPFYITGAEEMNKFKVVGIFGKTIRTPQHRGEAMHGHEG